MCYETPRTRWPELVRLRCSFLRVNLRHDCRCLVMFVREADEMWEELGYADRDDLLASGYDLVPEEIELAVRWLELNDPDYAIGIEEVKNRSAADRSRDAAKATDGKVLSEGRPSKQLPKLGSNRADRAASAGVSLAQQEKLDALARKAPGKLGEVKEGTKSVHRACIEAGIVSVPTPLQVVLRLLPRLDAYDLAATIRAARDRLPQAESCPPAPHARAPPVTPKIHSGKVGTLSGVLVRPQGSSLVQFP